MTDATAANADSAVLKFDHNVIEHLGIRLYQNKITNVIAELVANCWDADAEKVFITSSQIDSQPYLAIEDNGIGMDFNDICTRYLIIGKKKRASPSERSAKGRGRMGRKGIGKLAPFGIARKVDVITIKADQLNWFTLELSELMKGTSGEIKYEPPFVATKINKTDGWAAPNGHPLKSLIDAFLKRTAEDTPSQGTMIIMSALTTNEPVSDEKIVTGLAKKFTVVLARKDFVVSINEKLIDEKTALPEFEFRIPAEAGAKITEQVNGKDVTFWVGFVGSAEWSADEAGVGVFVHGKIGQERPFFFNAKGKEVYQRYLYGVVEADWLDELKDDLVSTDRTSINWADTDAEKLKAWGSQKVGYWITQYAKYRSTVHLREVKEAAATKRASKTIASYTPQENEAIDGLVADAIKDLGKGKEADEARDRLLGAVSNAWVNLPSRDLIKELWTKLSSNSDSTPFIDILEKLHSHSVPEAMGLALNFAQRAYALSILNKLIHEKSEVNLQKLLEDFPWIIQPRGDLLTADQHLKTTIDNAAKALGDDDNSRPGRIIKGMSDKERADFVFLTDQSKKTIKVIELKAPDVPLDKTHQRQLRDYMDYLEQFHSGAIVTGVLVGQHSEPKMRISDSDISAKSWDELLVECRASYIDLLAGMLGRSDLDPTDTRLKMVHEFGGEEVWELLGRLAKTDPNLENLMQVHGRSAT